MAGFVPYRPARPSCGMTRSGRFGFTMIEVLLAVLLLGLLAGMTVLSFTGWQGSGDLQEGADRVMSAIRSARADSALQGRRIRFNFETSSEFPDLLRIVVEWEPRPLDEPGMFEPYDAVWTRSLEEQWVLVREVRLVDQSAFKHLVGGPRGLTDDEADQAISPIDFYPDQTSDSAILVLVRPTEPDAAAAVIELDWLSGPSEPRLMTVEQSEVLIAERTEG